jgi:hypothetical protein
MCKFILHVLKYFIKNYCCKKKDKKCHMKSHSVPLKIVLYVKLHTLANATKSPN